MFHGTAGSVEDERCGSLTPLRSIAPQKARKGLDSAPDAVYVLNDGVVARFFATELAVWNTTAVKASFVIDCICDGSCNKKARYVQSFVVHTVIHAWNTVLHWLGCRAISAPSKRTTQSITHYVFCFMSPYCFV